MKRFLSFAAAPIFLWSITSKADTCPERPQGIDADVTNGKPVYYLASFSFVAEGAPLDRNRLVLGVRIFDKRNLRLVDSNVMYEAHRKRGPEIQTYDCAKGVYSNEYTSTSTGAAEKSTAELKCNGVAGEWTSFDVKAPDSSFAGTDCLDSDLLAHLYSARVNVPKTGKTMVVSGNQIKLSKELYETLKARLGEVK